MRDKIMKVFYGEDCLPYKDQEREVHYPIVGNSFAGASLVQEIRFYVQNIGGVDSVTWVANAKRSDGQVAYKQLESELDSELNEYYVSLPLSQWFTEKKGDLFIALNGYAGGVDIQVDIDSGLYTVSGTPVIQATGSIKLSINYAPIMNNGYGEVPAVSVQEALCLISTKLDKDSNKYLKVVIGNISNVNTSAYEDFVKDGDIVFNWSNVVGETSRKFWKISGTYPNFTYNEIALILDTLNVVNLEVDEVLLPNGFSSIVNEETEQNIVDYINERIATLAVQQTTSANKVYGTDYSGNQTTYDVDSFYEGNIARRDTDNSITVPLQPTQNGHAASKKYVDDTVKEFAQNEMQVVSELPLSGEEGIIYLLPVDPQDPTKGYYRYIWENNTWLSLGTTEIDLSDYYTKTEIDTKLDLVVEIASDTTTLTTEQLNILEKEGACLKMGDNFYYKFSEGTSNQIVLRNIPRLGSAIGLWNYYGKELVINKTTRDISVNTFDVYGYTKDETDTLLNAKQDTLVSGTNIKTINGTTLLGSGNYSFDSAFNELSTNALQNKVISKAIYEVNYQLAIINESLFEVVLDESDYPVDFATLYAIPDMIDSHLLVYSETALKEIKGNSVVMNQLARELSSSYWASNDTQAISFTDGIGTFVASAQYGRLRLGSTHRPTIINGHKYFVSVEAKGTTSNTAFDITLTDGTNNYTQTATIGTDWQLVSFIASPTNNGIGNVFLRDDRTSNWDAIQVKNVICVDLTQMFPTDTPTTTDDPRVQWLISQGYIAYNTGSLLNSNVSGLKIRGFNQWDEEWEVGTISYSTGENVTENRVRNKNYISVIPNTIYYQNYKNDRSLSINVFFYDINKSFISATSQFTVDTNGLFTTPSNCYYIRFIVNTSYGTTYKNDICINISNASLNGSYKPYTTSTISVPQTELISAGTVHNNIQVVNGDIVEGEQLYNLVKNENGGSYTFTGNETWTKLTSEGRDYYICNITPAPAKNDSNFVVFSNLITDIDARNVARSSIWGSSGETTALICIAYDRFTISNYLYQNRATLLTGKTINYEIATQTQTVIATGLHFSEVSSLIEQGGTIEMINTGTPTNTTTTFVVKKATGE